MRRAIREPMSRPVWMVLLSWGMAVLVISGLLSAWIWTNDRQQDKENAKVQREQDQAMCLIIDLFTDGPPPVAGPAGERGRVILAAMQYYQRVLHCEDFASEPPVKPRPRD
jgi:hypothetical protein